MCAQALPSQVPLLPTDRQPYKTDAQTRCSCTEGRERLGSSVAIVWITAGWKAVRPTYQRGHKYATFHTVMFSKTWFSTGTLPLLLLLPSWRLGVCCVPCFILKSLCDILFRPIPLPSLSRFTCPHPKGFHHGCLYCWQAHFSSLVFVRQIVWCFGSRPETFVDVFACFGFFYVHWCCFRSSCVCFLMSSGVFGVLYALCSGVLHSLPCF